jgi:hypothetical protein
VKLFEVTRWGNDADGGNGPDTNYLVCARDHEEAAALVREREPDLGAITELGVCSAQVERPVVLRGPYIQHKLDAGAYFTLWSWDPRGLGVWVPTPRCRDGEAICHYANGQLAARCGWRDGRQYGASEVWYSDGQLMHRAEYRRGNAVGAHDYWYADGTPAGRYEYLAGGVRYRQWDRAGRLVAEATEEWGRQEAGPGAAPEPAGG